MKKFCVIIAIVMALSVALPLAVSAHPDMTGDVGQINLPKSSPVIDGTISADDNWSAGKFVDKNTYGTFWGNRAGGFNWSCTLYYAYDEKGLYYAADIFDDKFIYSTGKDIKDGGSYGYNGDIFTFMIDPLQKFIGDGFTGNEDYTPWYCIGIFEGNTLKMTRTKFDTADITSQVKLAGSTTNNGWKFEAFIPWTIIAADATSAAAGDLTFTAEELYKSDALHSACVMYQDRYYDDESETVSTYFRYITVKNVLPDGTRGYLSSGDCLKSYGISLKVIGEGSTESAITDNGVSKLNTNSSSNPSSSNNSSAATFDAGIGAALVALVASGVGAVTVSKKRKK